MSDFNINMENLDDIIEIEIPELISQAEERIEEAERIKAGFEEDIEGNVIEPLQGEVDIIIHNIELYIQFLEMLQTKLDDYKVALDDTFNTDDINRQIYLDILGLDEWVKKIEELVGVHSKDINSIINWNGQSGAYEEYISECDNQVSDLIDIGDGEWGDGEIGDNGAEKRYRKSKKRMDECNEVLHEKLKFENELDEIIENVAKIKEIENIEEEFSVDSIIDLLQTVKESDYSSIPEFNAKGYGIKSPEEVINPNNFSRYGIAFNEDWELGGKEYFELLYKKGTYPNGDSYDMEYDSQMPYDVGDGKWTIGPGITVDQTGNFEQDMKNLYNRINEAIGTDYHYPKPISKEDLDAAAIVLMSEEYIPYVYSYIDTYNSSGATPEIKALNQHQIDALGSAMWNCWFTDMETYHAIALAQEQMRQGNNEEAISLIQNALINEGMGEGRALDTAELFVEGDYEINHRP